jgi:diguanylate cyclase (GGDEF)-like protein
MHAVLDSILAIDILLPPREYLAELLAVICSHLRYTSGIVVQQTAEDSTIIARHALDDATAAQVLALGAAIPMPGEGELVAVCLTPAAPDGVAPVPLHLLALPLCYQGQRLGSLHLYHESPRMVGELERLILQKTTEMAATAIVSNEYLGQLDQRTRAYQREIAERKRMETALREALRARKDLEDIVSHSPLVVFRCRITENWPIDFISESVSQFHYTPDEFYAQRRVFTDIIHTLDRKRVRQEVERELADGKDEFSVEFRLSVPQKAPRWVETRFWVRRDTDSPDVLHILVPPSGRMLYLQGIMQDITERKHAEEMIRHQAYHDMLTDLPNRMLFQDRLTHALVRARRHGSKLAVMFLDLDRFKTVNDTFGHAVGDQLLKGIAERLKTRLRGEDTISRLGGDEFTILLPEVKLVEDITAVARKIIQAFDMPFMLDGQEIHSSTSLGIALFPEDGDDAQTLLHHADTALYHAKEQGRNTFQFYQSTMSDKANERLVMENELRRALTQEQFTLFYQPQVSITTGEVIGMEALLRWRHPTLGTISPAQFIPVAEETGLIVPLGQWVLYQACGQNKAWQQAGHTPLRMAVNLSARQFHQHNLLEMVSAVLADTGLDPAYLELEITESVAMRDVEFSTSVMCGLREMGVQLSIDDFGVGHSSLIYLKKFPINTLKIDQLFVRGLTTDLNDQAIATAIITMARSMNLRVIAEGVESEEQLAFLRACACDGMQGYLFSKPLPADALTQFMCCVSP